VVTHYPVSDGTESLYTGSHDPETPTQCGKSTQALSNGDNLDKRERTGMVGF